MNNIIGFLGGQIIDPFKRVAKNELNKRKAYRKEYLKRIDDFQIKDLVE